jgi:hypothetical protein
LDRNQFEGLVAELEGTFKLGVDAPYPKAASTAAASDWPGAHRPDH